MNTIQPIEKKKRGRKKANPNPETTTIVVEEVKPAPKKRGRKPKGGKIIQQNISLQNKDNNEPNIILHLKCSLKDINESQSTSLKYNPNIETIQSFTFENNKTDFLLNNDNNFKENNDEYQHDEESNDDEDNDNNIKVVWKKLNSLKLKLHKNDISDKRSACFWCTYDFDNPPIFIPKNEFKNSYQVYGCFCSPQCGVAHLMNEKIDSSIKFERYQLLNHVYGKIYNYNKNIKPAPDPYYLLDKYYGTLSINEYRDLFNNEQLLIVVEKPLSNVFPELYEDNSDFILNKKTIPSNSSFKLKRKTNNNKKTSILDNFGINKN
jgi:hypothetical protein|uniref:MYM-type domain-containing protein n=1 Tax=viral metagenome TaxID=1070528 RepID=A0A6C0CWT3_9ZZZZ